MTNSHKKVLSRRRARIQAVFNPLAAAKAKGDIPQIRFKDGWYINALETPPFSWGHKDKYTWQIVMTFPCKIKKDEPLEQFKEAIQRAFEEIFFT